jgi:hypothetical protein
MTPSDSISSSAPELLIREAHDHFWNAVLSLTRAEQHQSPGGKWSPLQHLEHLRLVNASFSRYLLSDKEKLKFKFGLSDRPSRSFSDMDTVINRYFAQPVKAPEALVPPGEGSEETSVLHANSLSALNGLLQALQSWSEIERDQYLVPHPFLGALTVREMLYFNALHIRHHERLAGI